MHGQLGLVVAGLALAVEQQHGQRRAGDERAAHVAEPLLNDPAPRKSAGSARKP